MNDLNKQMMLEIATQAAEIALKRSELNKCYTLKAAAQKCGIAINTLKKVVKLNPLGFVPYSEIERIISVHSDV